MGTYQNNSEFYADFKTVEKNAKNLLTKKLQAKEVCKIGVCTLPILLTCKSFWQTTFSRYTFSNYLYGFEISVKFSFFILLC
jgi:hypothetical protein